MAAHDLVVRGGLIVDGSGEPAFTGDVAVKDGLISAIGAAVDGKGVREIDGTGLLITPGWVDIHSHYDGQVRSRSPFFCVCCATCTSR